jgi:hypothetical protein
MLGLLGAWLIATAAAAGVALAVVGAAGDQVVDEAVRPLSVREVEALGAAAPAGTAAPGESPAATVPGTGDPAVTSSTTGTTAAPPTSTVGTTATTTTSPAAAPTTTAASPATTTAPEQAKVDSRQITGGTVVVRWTAAGVELVSASPADGFDLDVDARGPEKVEVTFESEDLKSEYSAEVSDGELVVQVQVHREGDDGGDD